MKQEPFYYKSTPITETGYTGEYYSEPKVKFFIILLHENKGSPPRLTTIYKHLFLPFYYSVSIKPLHITSTYEFLFVVWEIIFYKSTTLSLPKFIIRYLL